MELDVFEERARVYERMRKAVASDRMDKVRSEDDFEKFMMEMDREKFLRKDEYETLQREFSEKQEDHDQLRQHLIQRLKLEQQAELQKAEMLGKLSLQRTITDATSDEEMAQQDHRLEASARRWRRANPRSGRRSRSGLKQSAWKRQTEHELDMQEATDGLKLVDLMKERTQMEADRELKRQLRARTGVSEIEMKAEAQRHQQELGKDTGPIHLSTEALIAAAPADRAAMLVELKRTESAQGIKRGPDPGHGCREKRRRRTGFPGEVQECFGGGHPASL